MRTLREWLDEFINEYFDKEDTPEGLTAKMKPGYGFGTEDFIGELGVYYAYFGDLELTRDITERDTVDEKYVTVAVGTCGEVMYHTKKEGLEYIDPGLNIFFNSSPNYSYSRSKVGKRIIVDGICMGEGFFESLPFNLPEDYWERSAKILNEGVVDHAGLFKLCNELHEQVSRLSGTAAKAFVYAKCIEAFSIMLDLTYRDEARIYPKLSEEDREALRQAREILESKLKDPPTIQELARTVGMNQQKLMKGFKQLGNTTVHGYLTQLRMQKAASLLQSSNMKVARIAQEVGYHGDGHFQKTFAAAFEMTPIEYRRQVVGAKAAKSKKKHPHRFRG